MSGVDKLQPAIIFFILKLVALLPMKSRTAARKYKNSASKKKKITKFFKVLKIIKRSRQKKKKLKTYILYFEVCSEL